jgi:hypothetical protein
MEILTVLLLIAKFDNRRYRSIFGKGPKSRTVTGRIWKINTAVVLFTILNTEQHVPRAAERLGEIVKS